MAVRGIDDEHVDARFDQRLDALLGIAADADRRADAQPLAIVLARVRIVARLLDVLDRDEAAQAERIVDDQHLLDAMLVQQREHFVLGRAFAHGHQTILARHDVLDRIVGLLLEAQIAVGHDADELLAVDDRHAGDVVCARDLHDFADRRRPAPTVIGSRITPDSNFLTRRTSAAWRSIVMFLWMMPMPPDCAIVIARRASVTVSIAAETIGRFRRIVRVRRVPRSTSRGSTSEYAGTSETSSKVRASERMRMAYFTDIGGGSPEPFLPDPFRR